MWLVVYVAQEKEQAEKIRELLDKKNILARVRHISDESFEVLVPSTELEEAQEVIICQ